MPVAHFTREGQKVFQRRTHKPSFKVLILIQHIAKGVKMLRGEEHSKQSQEDTKAEEGNAEGSTNSSGKLWSGL